MRKNRRNKKIGWFPGSGTFEQGVHPRVKRTGVFKDIIQETYQDYRAIVIGRTGVSRFKDLVIGMAREGNFGTIVAGRREDATFFEAHIRGRFSGKLMELMNNCAVWVVS